MRRSDQWTPSRFVCRRGHLRANRHPAAVNAGSRLMVDLVARAYEQAIPLYARGRLADLGCGAVPLFAAYRNHVTDVVCVDWPASAHSLHHIDLACDLAAGLPFRDRSFDTIVLSDVLEHVAEPRNLWLEMGRILSPSGHLLLNVPFCYWLHETPHDYYRYTEHALRYLASRSGLEILQLIPLGGSMEVQADFLAKHVSQLFWPGRVIAGVLQTAVLQATRSETVRRLSAKSARAFPLGYFLVAVRR